MRRAPPTNHIADSLRRSHEEVNVISGARKLWPQAFGGDCSENADPVAAGLRNDPDLWERASDHSDLDVLQSEVRDSVQMGRYGSFLGAGVGLRELGGLVSVGQRASPQTASSK